MMLRTRTNCCVLAEMRHVNGSTCDCKLHRGGNGAHSTQCLSGTQRKHLYVCRNAAVVMPKHFNFISMFPSILVDAVVALSLCGMNAIYISVFLEIE